MKTIEQQLESLPKVELRRWADVKIRMRLYPILVKNKLTYAMHWEISMPRVFRVAGAVALAGVVVLGTLSPYAYASSHVVQGHALYPLKRGMENVVLITATSPEQKMKTYAKFSERRIEEIKILSERAKCKNQDDCYDDSFHNTVRDAHIALKKAKAFKNTHQLNRQVEIITAQSENKLVEMSVIVSRREEKDMDEDFQGAIGIVRELRGEKEGNKAEEQEGNVDGIQIEHQESAENEQGEDDNQNENINAGNSRDFIPGRLQEKKDATKSEDKQNTSRLKAWTEGIMKKWQKDNSSDNSGSQDEFEKDSNYSDDQNQTWNSNDDSEHEQEAKTTSMISGEVYQI